MTPGDQGPHHRVAISRHTSCYLTLDVQGPGLILFLAAAAGLRLFLWNQNGCRKQVATQGISHDPLYLRIS